MDKDAIEEKAKALQKAADQGEPASTLVNMIKEFNKGVNATEELLRSTKIGSVIGKFRNHKNPEVARIARDTVNKWKAEVQKKRDSVKSGQKVGLPKSGAASPAPGAGAKSVDNATDAAAVKPENRSWRTDKVDIGRTNSDVRDKCIGMMYDGLVYLETKPASAILNVAIAIEEAAYKKYSPETSQPYRDKMRSLFLNLKNKTDSSLRAKVLLGSIPPSRLVEMSNEELKSRKAQDEEDKIRLENMREAQMPQEVLSVSDHLQCGKCKQKKVSYTQAQTRSADEPMTTFCTCTVCGNRWKFS